MSTPIDPRLAALSDYEAAAQERLDPSIWTYINGGGADELTLRDNRSAFERLRLQGRVLADMRGAHTRVTLFGQDYDFPILLAPVAYQKLAHPEGELATAAAAAALRTGMVVSTQASLPLETIAQAGSGPLWFQLYIQHDRAFTLELVRRAEAAGYQALVLTVDAPVNGLRNREQRAGFQLPAGVEAVNLKGLAPLPHAPSSLLDSPLFNGQLNTSARWEDVAWLKRESRLPLLLKGVLHPEDALRAQELGVDGIIVSNHGGRTLDTLPATLDVLPAIRQAVGEHLPLLLDGGIRRGTDVLKALALGANAVLVGRPLVHALAVNGAMGVAHMLSILRAELEVAMTLTGCATLTAGQPDLLWAPCTKPPLY